MKQFKKIVSNFPSTLCESNCNDVEYLMILKNICIKKKYNNVFKKTGIWLNLLANLHDQLRIIINLNIYKCIAHLF